MQTSRAIALAKELLNEHGYGHVPIRITNAKRQCGSVHWKRDKTVKYMSLSSNHISLNDEREVRETILHEIAHMIAGSKAGHGRIWKLVALRIGANPSATSKEAVTPPGRYKCICQECNKMIATRHRISARMFRVRHISDGGKVSWYDTTEKRWLDPSEARPRRRRRAWA